MSLFFHPHPFPANDTKSSKILAWTMLHLRLRTAVFKQTRWGKGKESCKRTTVKAAVTASRKRFMRRDSERQRRQEMASLFSSLRSLLPLEYIKGKLSISDHTHGAVNYIRHLQRKIKELGDRREKLKKLANSSGVHHTNRSPSCMPNCVAVNPCWGGAQIFITSSFKAEVFSLSRVLEMLLAEGLTVISCVSTKANERMLHTIHTEIGGMMCVDLSALQNKLTGLINM